MVQKDIHIKGINLIVVILPCPRSSGRIAINPRAAASL